MDRGYPAFIASFACIQNPLIAQRHGQRLGGRTSFRGSLVAPSFRRCFGQPTAGIPGAPPPPGGGSDPSTPPVPLHPPAASSFDEPPDEAVVGSHERSPGHVW